MGFVESGSFYLHKMRRHPQEPGSAHIQSQVGQPGPVDPGTNPGTVPSSGRLTALSVPFLSCVVFIDLLTHLEREIILTFRSYLLPLRCLPHNLPY